MSTRVGWSLWKGPADLSPKFGTYNLNSPYKPAMGDYGVRQLRLRLWMREMIKMHRPHVVAFEAPWIPMGPMKGSFGEERSTQQHTLRLLVGLANEVETTAYEMEVPRVLEVASSSAKLALTGTGRIPTSEKPRMMLGAAHDRGWECADDHQADAGAVGLVAYSSLS